MSQKNKKIIVLALSLLFCLVSSYAFSQGIEGNYPNPPGVKVTITQAVSLGGILKFWMGWAIVGIGVVILISLVYSGVLYLTSAGDAGRTGEARKRIINSATGIFILFSAYMVLTIVNPGITVIPPVRKIVDSGIFLFKDDDNTKDFLAGGKTLDEMVQLESAFYISQSYADLTKPLGDLVASPMTADDVSKIGLVNFKKFPLRGIGFWGDYGKRMKATLYIDKDFSYTPGVINGSRTYTYSDGVQESGLSFVDFKLKDGAKNYENTYFKDGIKVGFKYKDSTEGGKEKETANKAKNVLSPPLSLEILGNGPGIYLYTSKKNEKGEEVSDREKYVFTSFPDFGNEKLFGDFNDRFRFIAIKNEMEDSSVDLGKHDYLAILHEDKNYTGQLKISFMTKARTSWWPKEGGKNVLTDYVKTSPSRIIQNLGVEDKNRVPDHSPIKSGIFPLFNQDPDATYKLYGRVDKPSSIEVFEIGDDSVCKRVRLCTEREYLGYCLEYNSEMKKTSEHSSWISYSPSFMPQNLPVKLKQKNEAGQEETMQFDNNIKSIEIEGDCAVVLFENYIKLNLGESSGGEAAETAIFVDTDVASRVAAGINPTSFNMATEWSDGSPGEHSEVFTKSDKDLSDNKIGLCGWLSGIGFKVAAPCASAIAIYPIKVLQ